MSRKKKNIKNMNVFPFDNVLPLSLAIHGEIVSNTTKPLLIIYCSDSRILILTCGGIHIGSENITFDICFASIYFVGPRFTVARMQTRRLVKRNNLYAT